MRAFRYRAPTPLGPPILWAEKEAASTPSSCRFKGILPRACTASVWKRAPRSWASAASSRMGWMAPTSEFAACTETSTVSSVSASASDEASMKPWRLGRR